MGDRDGAFAIRHRQSQCSNITSCGGPRPSPFRPPPPTHSPAPRPLGHRGHPGQPPAQGLGPALHRRRARRRARHSFFTPPSHSPLPPFPRFRRAGHSFPKSHPLRFHGDTQAPGSRVAAATIPSDGARLPTPDTARRLSAQTIVLFGIAGAKSKEPRDFFTNARFYFCRKKYSAVLVLVCFRTKDSDLHSVLRPCGPRRRLCRPARAGIMARPSRRARREGVPLDGSQPLKKYQKVQIPAIFHSVSCFF